jgi:DNA-binding NarL/FixJ family response regulator
MTEAGNIRVAVAEDLALFRDGIVALIGGFHGIEVAGVAADGDAAWQLISSLRPDIALVDLHLTRLHALEIVRRTVEHRIPTRVAVLSTRSDRKTLFEALRAGASGILLKSSPAEHLRECILRMVEGGLYVSPQIDAQELLTQPRHGAPADPLAALSSREHQVFTLLVEGVRPKEIAACLGVSPKTVDTYRAGVMRKLDIHDLPGLVRCAVEHGLLGG